MDRYDCWLVSYSTDSFREAWWSSPLTTVNLTTSGSAIVKRVLGIGVHSIKAAAMSLGDFNADGIPDLAVANFGSSSVSILLGNGDGTFTAKSPLVTGVQPIGIAVGDFNLDGKVDLAVANNGSSNVSIQLGNQSEPKGLVAADFNGDGKLDLAVSEFGQNQTVILLGNGNGTFALQSAKIPAGSQPWSIGVGDFNGDGKPDLAVPNDGSSNLSVLLNSSSTTATATLSGVTICGTANQNIEAKYPGVAPYAASTSNMLSLPPI